MKKTISFALVIATLVLMAYPVAAATADTVAPRYTYTSSVYAYLDIDSWGVAHCSGDCIAYNAVKVKVKVYLEQYNTSTNSWVTVKSWEEVNTGVAAVDAYYAVYSGYQYRVRTVGYVYNSSGSLVEIVSAEDTMYY